MTILSMSRKIFHPFLHYIVSGLILNLANFSFLMFLDRKRTVFGRIYNVGRDEIVWRCRRAKLMRCKNNTVCSECLYRNISLWSVAYSEWNTFLQQPLHLFAKNNEWLEKKKMHFYIVSNANKYCTIGILSLLFCLEIIFRSSASQWYITIYWMIPLQFANLALKYPLWYIS